LSRRKNVHKCPLTENKVTANLFFELMITDIRENFCKTPSVDGFEQREMVDKFWNGQKS